MLIDIGANLTHESFQHDLDDVLMRAHEVDVLQIVVTGASLRGSQQALDMAKRYENLWATAGIHPHHAEETTVAMIAELEDLTWQEKVVAVGETGLDFFRDFSPRPAQVTSFEVHIELAQRTGLPMFLHERDSYPVFSDILKSHRDDISRQVVHCFTGEKSALYSYLDLDCYIGITGWICDEKRGKHLLSLVQDIPSNRLMIETDAPYLLPKNIKPKPKSRRNEPMYLPVVAEKVAACLGVSIVGLIDLTTENARQFFELPDPNA